MGEERENDREVDDMEVVEEEKEGERLKKKNLLILRAENINRDSSVIFQMF